jgi:hypothetical protein
MNVRLKNPAPFGYNPLIGLVTGARIINPFPFCLSSSVSGDAWLPNDIGSAWGRQPTGVFPINPSQLKKSRFCYIKQYPIADFGWQQALRWAAFNHKYKYR